MCTHLELRRKLVQVGFLLLSHGSQGWDSGLQVSWQVPTHGTISKASKYDFQPIYSMIFFPTLLQTSFPSLHWMAGIRITDQAVGEGGTEWPLGHLARIIFIGEQEGD